ncbi:TIR_2 superfamily protein [Psychroflexus torquis ATCC 700755]|uniref:TIR_2 superfamily protein n=1 Tax=Psychroflexus torquis (strain ATCC 700755 / CIP 106069 / ACAM 623) TaxID=313595 RepID=K4IIC3_PSYTT|nr:toll/interleukin-1 receptor domain-containing protein [Psychroflexus torquis]AFU69553.1 TIR_2 superfamily protein [Psychroflexus torquis ATCC 700755]
MKIFILHSSKNANYGNALVNLLTGIGISGDQIIFTSNDAYGIPIGQNIFDWLKNQIVEKPYVLYLLSSEYYKSVACLNEMGAAWVIENKHTMIFTPNFKLDSYEFQNGAIDPREIGFYINNNDKLIAFIDSLRTDYNVTTNPVLINQKIREFLDVIGNFNTTATTEIKNETLKKSVIADAIFQGKKETKLTEKSNNSPKKYVGKSRFFNDLMCGKLKDEEVILTHYIIDTARFRLFTGWQESQELDKIKAWEDVNGINSTLSDNYESALRRFEMKKLISVSAVTSGGKTKELQIIEELQDELLDLPTEVGEKINEIVDNNLKTESEQFNPDNWN